jgi:hypothetical protein
VLFGRADTNTPIQKKVYQNLVFTLDCKSATDAGIKIVGKRYGKEFRRVMKERVRVELGFERDLSLIHLLSLFQESQSKRTANRPTMLT